MLDTNVNMYAINKVNFEAGYEKALNLKEHFQEINELCFELADHGQSDLALEVLAQTITNLSTVFKAFDIGYNLAEKENIITNKLRLDLGLDKFTNPGKPIINKVTLYEPMGGIMYD